MSRPGRLAPASTVDADPLAAAAIFRGVRRALAARGLVSLSEFPLANGRRVDIIALDDRGRVTIIEVKSCAVDFCSDKKWRSYLDWCDKFYFAVDSAFPGGLIPQDCGLLVADAYGAAELRPATVAPPLAAARRRALTLRFAMVAAGRLYRLDDPQATGGALSV